VVVGLGLRETFCCARDIGQGLMLMEKYRGNRSGLFNERKRWQVPTPLEGLRVDISNPRNTHYIPVCPRKPRQSACSSLTVFGTLS